MALAALGVVSTVRAQDDDFWGRFSLGERSAFNISASFSGVGGFTAPGVSGTGVQSYNDGYVADVNSPTVLHTADWGYDNASQITSQLPGGDVVMRSSSSQAVSAGDAGNGAQSGMELDYTQPLVAGKFWHLGWDAAFDWTGIHIQDSRPMSGDVVTTAQIFALGAVFPPNAPYSGSGLPGQPLLSTTAIPDPSGDSTQIGAASITGTRKIDADLFGVKLGPSLEFPLGKYFSIGLGGGFAFGVIDSEFSYDETVTVAGLGTQTHAASGHTDGWVSGGYARAQANLHLDKRVSLFSGVEFDDLGVFNQTVGGETAHLDLSRTVYVTGGISINF